MIHALSLGVDHLKVANQLRSHLIGRNEVSDEASAGPSEALAPSDLSYKLVVTTGPGAHSLPSSTKGPIATRTVDEPVASRNCHAKQRIWAYGMISVLCYLR